ncbi:MAG: hypothetical protein US76_01830 [Parcubacteria group bacterium GW2011_GWA2_38_13b]|nr:MAG: hypothetical protein US76_01830 [Parcubacteria group bacterium GW2011_GWA2_38_13b]
MKKYLFYFIIVIFGVGLYPLFSAEASQEFYVNSEYEPTGNTLEEAVNLTSSTRAQFFVEKDYYDKLSEKDKDIFLTKTAELGVVFDSEIYFKIKSLFGDEWMPGIDNDSRITVYITDMKSEINGYFREIDEYDYFKYSNSNQREMVYINAKYVIRDTASAILAHEFQHLIMFNQKKRLRVLDEEEWLNEAMSEYAITFSGQDKSDYLKNAVKNFLAVPTDALGIWEETANDRASVSLFIHYLAEQYGENVIRDILQASFVGEKAINYALQKNGFDKNFSDVFRDWTIALFLNSSLPFSNAQPVQPGCTGSTCATRLHIYKFQHPDLRYSSFHIVPQLTYSVSETGINAGFAVRDLAPEWHRFLPSKYDQENPRVLRIDFSSRNDYYFRIPVVITYLSGKIDILETKIKNGKGFVEIPDFNVNVSSVVIIPASHTKLSDFSQRDPLWTFSYSVSLVRLVQPGRAIGATWLHQNGDLIRIENRPEVYIVKNTYRRHLQDSKFFNFYGHLKWENVKIVLEDIIKNYKESKLIKKAGDYKVYEVIGFRQFRWLDMTVEEFEESGRKWEAVYEVNNAEWSWYQEI